MRGVLGFIAVLMLVVLSQPALATCVYRAMVKTCTAEKHGFWKNDPSPAVETDTTASIPTPPTANAPSDNAWLMTPATTDGPVVVVMHASGSDADAAKAVCGSDGNC